MCKRAIGFSKLLGIAALLLMVSGAANAFVDNFDDASSSANWNDLRSWVVIENGMMTKTTPSGDQDYLSAKELFTYGVFNARFRTTTTPGTYAYMGWHGMGWTPNNSFANPVAYMRLDTNLLHLCVVNGSYVNGSALAEAMVVTPDVWHNLQMVWKAGSIEVSLDGVSGGTFTSEFIPSVPLELALRTYNAVGDGAQIINFDSVSVTPVPVPEPGSLITIASLCGMLGMFVRRRK